MTSRQAIAIAVLSGAFALSVWCVVGWCMGGPRYSFAGLWPSAGFLAAALFYLSGRARFSVALGAAAVQFAILLLAGRRFDLALLHSAWDMVEALAAAILAQFALGPRRLLRSPGGFIRLQLLAVAPACIAASIGFRLTVVVVDPVAGWNMQESVLAHLLGMGVVLPAMLLAVQPALPALRRSWRETAVILGGVGLILLLLFHQTGPPALILFPTLLFATLRLGPRGAAVSAMMTSLLAMPVVASGGGPFTIHPEWTFAQRVSLYQLTVASLLTGVTMMGFMLAQQGRLAQLLERRAALARSARRRAIQASKAKTEFLANMSHEVRTPMNSILGFTAVLAGDPSLSPEARGRVDMIGKAGNSLMALLNDILDFSKVEAGQLDLERGPVDLIGVCREVIEIVGPMGEAKGLQVAFAADPSLQGLHQADGLRLRQVLLNLLNNAVKFTAQGQIRLSARALRHDGQTARVRFEVTDTGIGIDPNTAPRLFGRFSQADSSVSRNYGGTGLGLAICKGLVERMGGRIGVDSRLGEGSTFWFELPLETSDRADHVRADAAADRTPLNARVLLVDDHPVNRQLGQALLEMLGCRVGLAEDGHQAVEAAARGEYDAILMDVHMPGMDGLTAARTIRKMGGPGASIPIIALSADVLPQNIAQCLKAGMVDHVPKPVQLDVLHAALRRWLPETASGASASAA